MIEAEVTQVVVFKNSRQTVQVVEIAKVERTVLLDGVITHPKRREVLEEVRALTGVNQVVGGASLYNKSGGSDLWPLNRDA